AAPREPRRRGGLAAAPPRGGAPRRRRQSARRRAEDGGDAVAAGTKGDWRMSRAVVIGGSGHIGTYLVPRLVEAGFEVVNVSRGERAAYIPHAAWGTVKTVKLDRDAEEKAG